MPNWCSNKMVVVGPKEDLINLVEKLEEAQKIASEKKYLTLYCLLLALGYSEEEANQFDFKGYFTDFERTPWENQKGVASITVWYESAWTPCIDAWEVILHRHFNDCAQYTLAEEPGCEVYVNTDPTGEYLPEQYNVDASYNNSYFQERYDGYYETKEKALEDINEWLGKSFKSIEEVEAFFEEAREDDDEAFFSFHEYTDWN